MKVLWKAHVPADPIRTSAASRAAYSAIRAFGMLVPTIAAGPSRAGKHRDLFRVDRHSFRDPEDHSPGRPAIGSVNDTAQLKIQEMCQNIPFSSGCD